MDVFDRQGVLGDEHGFVRLVDSMPQIIHCDFVPEPKDELIDDDAVHCDRAGTVEVSSGWRFCAEHARDFQLDPPGGQPELAARVETHTASGDQRIVDAARNSVAGLGVRPTTDDRKLIRYLVKNKHTTPLEFVRFTFQVRLPIFVARQWIRHRTGSFNEESARYGQLRGDFYLPPIERLMAGGQAKKNKQGSGVALSRDLAVDARITIEHCSTKAYQRYEQLLAAGVARELARMVLPVNIYTQWYWTTDLHNLMHFLRLRLHEHAQWEVRQYAEAILPMAEALAPLAMEAFRETLGER